LKWGGGEGLVSKPKVNILLIVKANNLLKNI